MSIKEIGSTRIHNKSGYVFIKTEDGWIFQHRYVMEQVLNRKLLITEVVHHIDHNIENNNPSNLQIMTVAEHTILHHKGSFRTAEVKSKIAKSKQKLDESYVDTIKNLIIEGNTQKKVAAMFKVSEMTISRLFRNLTYKGVSN